MTLDQLFLLHGADKSSVAHGYNRTYEELFSPLRDKPITLLEIGVYQGASIRSWLDYFPIAHVIGIDTDTQWAQSSDRYTFFHGNQTDLVFLDQVKKMAGPFDIVVDDGSHVPIDQQVSFRQLWPAVRAGGHYVVEDTQCQFDMSQDQRYREGALEFLWTLAATVNWQGRRYIGRPGPAAEVDPRDPAFEWVRISKGLLIVKKAP